MQIGLTKKLADYAGIKIAPADLSVDPLFSWSANLLTIHRKKTIVCMNDASRFAFILYGVKAADMKRLDQLMLNGIRSCMAPEAINPEFVERYLLDGKVELSAPEVTYTKTSSRKAVAALNQVCSYVENMGARDPDEFPSHSHRQALNRIGFPVEKDTWGTPYDLLAGMLRERYGEPVVRSDAAELTVMLDLDDRDAVRRLLVPTFYTFAELHQVIQSVYRWQDYHMHEFILEEDGEGEPKETLVGFDDGEGEETENRRLDTDVRLSEVFGDQTLPDDVITYRYDFGDGWEHFIQCERIVKDYNKNYAQCTSMEGDAPPEDVGGPGGFQNLLTILGDENHSEYAEMKAWADGMRWKPLAEGDMDKVNRQLARRQYRYIWY
jgi:hypothetical protein